jgi:hypothetical protein
VAGNFDRNVIAARGQHKVNWAIRGVSASIQAVAEPALKLCCLGLGMGTLPAAIIDALATAYCEMKRFALIEPATSNGRILDVFGMEHL